jgi:hypothetical protein
MLDTEAMNEVTEQLEKLDRTVSVGWGEYPLDSVFVRTEQRTVIEVVRQISVNRYELNPDFQGDFLGRLMNSCRSLNHV